MLIVQLQESWTPLQAHFKLPESVGKFSNLIESVKTLPAGLDIGKSVNGNGAAGVMNQGALPYHT